MALGTWRWLAHMEHGIEDIVERVRNAKARDRSCSLLIGAGCSVKAGIPLASEFVDIIKDEYERCYERAEPKTYASCMEQLTVDERRDLIGRYVDKAKINWAHVAIALLMRGGYVDRVLTTNFDPLVVRACALLGEFPAVYDFATSQLFKPAQISDKAVFYLHGQREGFALLNTDEQVNRHSGLLRPVFQDAGQGRLWIVIGYSGDNDPVFEQLAEVSRFDNGLYWIGYQEHDPSKHVRERLLEADKDAFYTRGFDADGFFIALAQKLDIFPPQLISQPFDHLDAMLEMLAPYPVGEAGGEQDVTKDAREAIKLASTEYERRRSLGARAQELLMAGKYDEVVALSGEYEKNPTPELADTISTALLEQGLAARRKASAETGAEADRLFAQAGEKYEAALAIKSDMNAALNNWGVALAAQAKTRKGEEADRLFTLAGEKYKAALAVKPAMHAALNNWGNALVDQAKTKEGEEVDQLFALSVEKLQQAEELSAGSGAYNLACVAALRGEEEECHEWLEKSRDAATLESLEHINNDTDLDGVRDSDWFKEFIAGLDQPT